MTKATKWSVRPVKSQISLGIRPVWSASSLSVASAQSDQSLRCPHENALDPWLSLERTAKTKTDENDLCLRWAHRSFCWFCHAAAQLILILSIDTALGYVWPWWQAWLWLRSYWKKREKQLIQIFDKATSVKTIYKQSSGTGIQAMSLPKP